MGLMARFLLRSVVLFISVRDILFSVPAEGGGGGGGAGGSRAPPILATGGLSPSYQVVHLIS